MEHLTTQALAQLVNASDPTAESPDEVQTWSLVLVMVVSSAVIVIGSLGNLLTLVTLAHQFCMPVRLRCIKYMTPDTVLIINLALADFLYSAFNLPFMFITYYTIYEGNVSGNPKVPWENYKDACSFSAFLRYTNAISEWTTLGLMALERCICIHKFRHNSRRPNKWFTCWKTFFYCLSIWLFGIALQMPTYLGVYGTFGYNNITLKCDFMATSAEASPRIMFFTMETAIPCILIFIGNNFILVQVYANNSRILSVMGSHACQQAQLRRSRTTSVIVRLLIVFLICVIPICLYNIIFIKDDATLRETIPELGIVLYCIYFLQYCINNFIYVVCFEKYRCAYYQFLCFILCRKVEPLTTAKAPPLRPSNQVYTISKPSGLQVPEKRFTRTPSECEEESRAQNDPEYQQWPRESPSSSLSSQASLALEIPVSRLASSLRSPGASVTFECDAPDRRHTFGSVSTSSSSSTLVLSAAKKCSLKRKLKRTFSR